MERDGNDVLWISAGDDYLYMSEYISGRQGGQELSSAGPNTIVTAPERPDHRVHRLTATSSCCRAPPPGGHRRSNGDAWGDQIAAANAAVATTEKRRPGKSVLRVYTYQQRCLEGPVKLSTKAKRPAVAPGGKTVAWVSGSRIYTSKR